MDIKLGDHYILNVFSQDIRKIVLACYVAKLASGATLLATYIRVGTMCQYLNAVRDLFLKAKPKNVSPLLDIFGKKASIIEDLLKEAKQ